MLSTTRPLDTRTRPVAGGFRSKATLILASAAALFFGQRDQGPASLRMIPQHTPRRSHNRTARRRQELARRVQRLHNPQFTTAR